MVKLLGIVGSPRRGGNTEYAVREALRAGEREGFETELLHLADFDIRPCDGCETCFETKKCVIKDDVERIIEKMAEADGIIIGSPVYFYNTTSHVKAFIDRVGFLDLARGRTRFANKVGGAIAVAAREGLTSTLSQIVMLLTDSRMITVSPLGKVLASEKGGAAKDKRGMEGVIELGERMVEVVKATASLRTPSNK